MTLNLIAQDQGFTLAEAVMSLLVVSLALAGLLQVTSHNTKAQARIGNHQTSLESMDAQSAALKQIVAKIGPVGTQFTGRADYFSAKDSVGADHLYRAPRGWGLQYLANGQSSAEWPPRAEQNLEAGVKRSRLEAIALIDDKGQPVSSVRIRLDQGRDCQFDMISRECRVVAP